MRDTLRIILYCILCLSRSKEEDKPPHISAEKEFCGARVRERERTHVYRTSPLLDVTWPTARLDTLHRPLCVYAVYAFSRARKEPSTCHCHFERRKKKRCLFNSPLPPLVYTYIILSCARLFSPRLAQQLISTFYVHTRARALSPRNHNYMRPLISNL